MIWWDFLLGCSSVNFGNFKSIQILFLTKNSLARGEKRPIKSRLVYKNEVLIHCSQWKLLSISKESHMSARE